VRSNWRCRLRANSGSRWRAATTGEGDVSLSVRVLQRWRHSTGSDCKILHCPPKYSLCGSSLRTSDTGSPNTHSLYLSRSPRTTGPRKPKLAVTRQTPQQERRWYLESSDSSSASILDAVNNTERPVSIRPGIPLKAYMCIAHAHVCFGPKDGVIGPAICYKKTLNKNRKQFVPGTAPAPRTRRSTRQSPGGL